MNNEPPVHQSDLRPLEFGLAVVIGGMGSAVLSSLHVHPLFSVGFALTVMLVLAFLRWRIASEFRDFESLEAFAEDIYLLGYLLTLAALLGLAPRLMSDETNLFNIAGLKLVTTVVGLALMMIFRQTARRWAKEEDLNTNTKFKEQQLLFSEAVRNLNEGADALTKKLDEVVRRFDPDVLLPVAEWSNKAVAAFSTATKSLELVPGAVEKSTKSLTALNGDLENVRKASQGLAVVFVSDTAKAAGALAFELGQTGQAVNGLGATVGSLQPAGERARIALEKLNGDVGFGVAHFNEIGVSLNRVGIELKKLDDLLKTLTKENHGDVKTPLNRLVEALGISADKTTISIKRMEDLAGGLQNVCAASHELGKALGEDVTKMLMEHQKVVERAHQELARADEQMARTSNQLEVLIQAKKPGVEIVEQVVVRLSELQAELKESTTQIKAAMRREDGKPVAESKPRYFGLFGGGK